MRIFDGLLSQVGAHVGTTTIAKRVGIPPEKVEMAIAALGVAHCQPGDTIEIAADASGMRSNHLHRVAGELGGETALGNLATLLGRGPFEDQLSQLYVD
jgi:hypothetical protein